jgi:integrase
MKLFDRHMVEETSPKVYIGRRIYVNRKREERVAAVWYAEATLGGKTRYAPLKTASLSVAIHRAHQFADTLRETARAPVSRSIDLPELARQYLTMQVNRDRAPQTLEKYEYTLAAFVAWASGRFTGSAEHFTEALLWEWHKAMVDDGYAPKTRCDRLVIVKQAFKWARRQKMILFDPLEAVHIDEPPPTLQPCFEPEQVQALLDAASDSLESAIFATLAYTGLRFGELRTLRWSDVVTPAGRAGHVMVRDGGSRGRTKDNEFRRVPLHPKLRDLLAALPRRGDRVFYSPPCKRHPLGDRQLNQSTWLKRLKAACERCGFASPRQYKLHTFRHSFASMCARSNVAYRYALAWMGHSSSEILDMYFKQFDSAADQAIQSIDYSPVAVTS